MEKFNYWNQIKKKIIRNPSITICENELKISGMTLLESVWKASEELTEDCYAVLCKSKLLCAIALLACEAAGKCAMILPYEYGDEVCRKILEKNCPTRMITDIYGELGIVELNQNNVYGFVGNPPSVILYTSGSTGGKKGVMLDSEAIMTNVLDISEYFPMRKGDKILIFRSLCHASALTSELLLGLYVGADIVFYSGKFSPRKIIEIIEKEKITVIGGTPTAIGTIASMIRRGECRSIRLINLSGEKVLRGWAERIRRGFPHTQIFCGYGLTEASPRVAYLPPEFFDEKYDAAGFFVGSLDYKILPSGELAVKGNSVMRGYLGYSSDEKIKDGWLHTGDCAYMGDDGLLYIRGRIDDMINRAGINVYPAEIENALLTDGRAREVLAYRYIEGGEDRIGVKISGDFNSQDELVLLCRDKLPMYMMPSRIKLVKDFEVTENGKIKRRAI